MRLKRRQLPVLYPTRERAEDYGPPDAPLPVVRSAPEPERLIPEPLPPEERRLGRLARLLAALGLR